MLPADTHNLPATLDAVRALEAALLKLPQVDLNTQHVVFGGVSARAILIPAGTTLTGAQTNCDNVCIILGHIAVTTDEGTVRINGFGMLPARRGAKRAGSTITDTWWITVHATGGTTVQEAEDEMTGESSMLQTRREVVQ